MEQVKVRNANVKGTRVRKNLDISKSLFDIFFNSLRNELREQSVITEASVDRIERRLRAAWPQVETLFDGTCAACMDAPRYIRNNDRKDFVTRLVFAKILMHVPERPIPDMTGQVFPRIILPGLRDSIGILLNGREWAVLNEHVRLIFDYVGGDDDTTLMQQMKLNPAVGFLCQRVFVTLLLRFKGFNARRLDVMRRIEGSLRDSSYRLQDSEFCQIFEGLFREYHDLIQTDEGRLRVSMSYSDDAPETLENIFAAYFRFKEGVTAVGATRNGRRRP